MFIKDLQGQLLKQILYSIRKAIKIAEFYNINVLLYGIFRTQMQKIVPANL